MHTEQAVHIMWRSGGGLDTRADKCTEQALKEQAVNAAGISERCTEQTVHVTWGLDGRVERTRQVVRATRNVAIWWLPRRAFKSAGTVCGAGSKAV